MGEAATTCITATPKDHRGRARANEPAVIHRSSFGEGMGGGFDSFMLVFFKFFYFQLVGKGCRWMLRPLFSIGV